MKKIILAIIILALLIAAIIFFGKKENNIFETPNLGAIPKEAVDAAIEAEKIKLRAVLGSVSDTITFLEQAEQAAQIDNPFNGGLIVDGDYTEFVNVYAPLYAAKIQIIKNNASAL
jgi:hypothetical protein